MDKFKSALKKRMLAMKLYALAVAAVLTIDVFWIVEEIETNALSFTLGACVGTLALVIFLLRKYALAMRDGESLKRLYIEETDERHRFIASKTGGSAINIAVGGLVLGAVVAGFFNDVVSFTLFGGALFTALVKGALKLYYNKSV
jgi:hypothetical protein